MGRILLCAAFRLKRSSRGWYGTGCSSACRTRTVGRSVRWAGDLAVSVAESILLCWTEVQTDTVDAVTDSRLGWSVGENVTQMGVAFSAANFHPDHAVGCVSNPIYPRPFDFPIEAGPSASRLEFGGVRKQCAVADLAVVASPSRFPIEITGERPLRSVPA